MAITIHRSDPAKPAVRVAAALGSILLAATLGACSPAPEPVAPPGVSVSLLQSRGDVAVALVAIKVRNDGEAPVRVASVSYRDPRFASVPEWVGASDIPAGRARDLRVEVPPPACDQDDSNGTGTALVRFQTANGAVEKEYEVTDPLDFVSTYFEAACFAERVASAGSLELERVTTQQQDSGEVAVMRLKVTAGGADAIRVGPVRATVLLSPESGGLEWPLDATVAPGTSQTFDLPTVPARCDPHAVAEDKVGTRFRVGVTILAETPVTGDVMVIADDAQRAQLYGYIRRFCGIGE